MRQLIILLFISIVCTNFGISQFEFSSKLVKLEKEYFDSKNEMVKNQILVKKVNEYILNNSISKEVLSEVKRINYSLLPAEEQTSFLWNASLISFLNRDTYYSLHFISKYTSSSSDTSTECKLLKFLIYANYDTVISSRLIQELALVHSDFLCLDCLHKINNYELKNKRFIKNSSFFIPGLGMMLTGDIRKGTTSLAINTATVISIGWLFHARLFINMATWGSNLITKFYVGNNRLTTKLIAQKEAKNKKKLASTCELSTSSLLANYPLNFKL